MIKAKVREELSAVLTGPMTCKSGRPSVRRAFHMVIDLNLSKIHQIRALIRI